MYFNQSSFSAYGQIPIAVKDYVNFTLGTLVSFSTKSVKDGCSVFVDCSYTYPRFIVASGAVTHSYLFFYGCEFQCDGTNYLGQISTLNNVLAWHCVFDNVELVACVSPNLFDCVFVGGKGNADCYLNYLSGSAVLDRVSCFGAGFASVYWYSSYQCNYTGLYSRGAASTFYTYSMTVDNFLVNADIDSWSFYNLGTSSGEVYRQYTFDLFVLNGVLTDFVEDANVTLTHDGTVFGSWLTNSTGQISTQTLTYGFYNQTGGNTMYGGTAWTLTITHPDWANYTSKFYPYAKMDWSISMQEETASGLGIEDTDANVLVFALIAVIVAVIAYLIGKR